MDLCCSLDVERISWLEVVPDGTDDDPAGSEDDEHEHVVVGVDGFGALTVGGQDDAIDAEFELGMRETLGAGRVSNHGGLADSRAAEAGQQIGDGQVQRSAQTQQHGQ